MPRLVTIFALLLLNLPAQEPAPQALEKEEEVSKDPKPEIKQISEHQFQIGKIHLNQKKRELSFGAGVNMTEGLLEYLLVTSKSDKVHETLFLSDISPLNLNIGLKLLGVGESPELFQLRDPETMRPTGEYPEVKPEVSKAALVDLIVEWEKDGKKKSVPLNELINHIDWPEETEGSAQPGQNLKLEEVGLSVMEAGPWLSTGSYVHEGRFKAETIGMMIAIYTSEQAIVNFPGKDRQAGDVWIPNKDLVPPEGTVVKIIIKPHSKKAKKSSEKSKK